MAALQSIRGRAGLLVTALGVALLAFILGDFFNSGSAFFNKVKDNAFSVDGEVVSTGEYSERIENWETFLKIVSGRSSLDENQKASARDYVYNQMVNEIMLDKQAEKLGLAVTADEINAMVYGINVSPTLFSIPLFMNPETRSFDRGYLINFLEGMNVKATSQEEEAEIQARKQIWITIENLLKYEKLSEKYAMLMSSTFLTNKQEVASATKDETREVNIAYAMQPYTSISDSAVIVTEADINALYEKRKNNFKLDSELRKVSYFVKDVIPSDADYAEVEKDMQAGLERFKTTADPSLVVNDYNDNHYVDAFQSAKNFPIIIKEFVAKANIGDTYGPIRENQKYSIYKLVDKSNSSDSISIQIIGFPADIPLVAVNQVADSLVDVLKKGANFKTVAQQYMPMIPNAGEAMMYDEYTLIANRFPASIINGAVGSVQKTTLGGQTAILRIAGRSKVEPRVKLAKIESVVSISDKTQNNIDSELNVFINKYGSAEAFDEAAEKEGYSIVKGMRIHPADQVLEQTEGTRNIIHWAFDEKVGSVKKFDFSDKRIVAMLSDKIEGEYLPVKEVETVLKAELIRDKKAEKIISDLTAKSPKSIEQYAEIMNTKVDSANYVSFGTREISGVGIEPLINAYAKVGAVNTLAKPSKGYKGVYALNIGSENMVEVNEEKAKMELGQMYFQLNARGAMQALQSKMNVKDNRVKF